MNTENKNQSTLLKILGVLLAVSFALNIILFLKRTETFPAKKELISDNRSLLQKVNQYKNELDKFQGISNEIDRVVRDASQKMEEMEEKEKQIARLRQNRKVREQENLMLTQQLDSLQELYINVIDSLLVESEARKIINNKIESLEDIIAGLNKQLGYAALLNADNLKVRPIKKSNSGRKQPTAIARKVNSIEITVDILANRVSKPGLKTIYVVFTSPDAKVLADQRTGLIEFSHPEYQKAALCSLTEGINYKNDKIGFTAQFQPEAELRPGLYVAEVFTNENKLGMTTFSLE